MRQKSQQRASVPIKGVYIMTSKQSKLTKVMMLKNKSKKECNKFEETKN